MVDYFGSRLRNRTNFSSSGMLSRISEVADEPKIETNNCENSFSCYGSWGNDYSYYAEYFPVGIKREIDDDDRVPFANSQTVKHGNRPHILSHHFSLPKSSAAEFGAMEKLLHFQDRVPCKVRAKRGFATHPRSIAERVRRTKISERMRKLQDLVPNMDKQTNTADMLDFAVEYIKDLQKQYKALRELRQNCKCSA
ncbi:basic helix-loop-helix (bHLH) DNA-bindingsuperfamily protein [Striga asiatica]|uniref:Basic helix-loop-helix (BHLH) DNA-bindingsuperfamily protein n=1 Tax=Striga asiatica TaxID=4170 RepID=A0A5A7R488_STRAF|nr:basic helix-loop-helix (bHLH) DNA-bindingsuperfamily protein [Striga asiatica]